MDIVADKKKTQTNSVKLFPIKGKVQRELAIFFEYANLDETQVEHILKVLDIKK